MDYADGGEGMDVVEDAVDVDREEEGTVGQYELRRKRRQRRQSLWI